ncbi:MAG TPA: SAM-dependent methyltransferase [Rhodopila sp.]|nr:SAM-dependent methyltransferase [Rhodopila sp.]
MIDRPERLDHFMARANAIYYASRDPFADFTTSPEISQVFGEILGLWSAVAWQLLGSPVPVLLVEAGPGRGTLMADALRAIRQAAPDFGHALQVHLIETSPRLRAAQAARVPEATWHAALDGVPEGPMVLLANEFLDALPVRQFIRRGDGWTERYVTDGKWIELPADAAEVPPGRARHEGDVVELNTPARAFVGDLAQRLGRTPGAGLFLDYGPARSAAGDSLQALAGKQPVDPLSLAGAADLTAHVDFADMAAVARKAGALVQGPETQGAFLTALGLCQRTDRLARSQPEKAQALLTAARRLAEPTAMGTQFKVLAVRSPSCPVLPGFG